MGIVELAQRETKRNIKRMISEYEGIAERHNRALREGRTEDAESTYQEYLNWREDVKFQQEMTRQMLKFRA